MLIGKGVEFINGEALKYQEELLERLEMLADSLNEWH